MALHKATALGASGLVECVWVDGRAGGISSHQCTANRAVCSYSEYFILKYLSYWFDSIGIRTSIDLYSV